jgi:CRISPR/Cas system-associated exonuclease Cas4 (RecB family)
MKTLRASEIGSYLYCQRAWWYQLQGIQSENQAELAGGRELHRRHGRTVMTSGCLRYLAYALLLAALILLTIYLTGKLI